MVSLREKGTPVPLAEANIMGMLSSGSQGTFIVSTPRAVHVYRVKSLELANEWVRRLIAAQSRARNLELGTVKAERGESIRTTAKALHLAKITEESLVAQSSMEEELVG